MSTSGFPGPAVPLHWFFVGWWWVTTTQRPPWGTPYGFDASYLSWHQFIIIHPPHSGLHQPLLKYSIYYSFGIFLLKSRFPGIETQGPGCAEACGCLQACAAGPSHQPSIPCQAVSWAKPNQAAKARNSVFKKWLTRSVITISELVSYVNWVLCQRTWHVWHCLRC